MKPTKSLAEKIVGWYCEKYKLDVIVVLKIGVYSDFKCWGECSEPERGGNGRNIYEISIAKDQNIRNFIATVMHEMVHVKQWERKRWTGDGEEEAERMQHKLADKYWREGNL